MKKLLCLLVLPGFAFIAPPENEVKMKGKMTYAKPVDWVFLSYRADGALVRDSAKLKNGEFEFEKKIAEPVLASLIVRFEKQPGETRGQMDGMQIYLEPGEIEVTGADSLKNAKVTGSKTHTVYTAFIDLQKPFTAKRSELSKQYMEFNKAKDEQGMKKVQADMKALTNEVNESVFHTYLVNQPSSPIALYVLKQYAGYDIDVVKIEPLFASLPASTQASPSGKEFKNLLEAAKKTSIGSYAMDFIQNDTLGKPVSLSSLKGKYVLVDFWASWCGPCRAENPNVVRSFHKYKDKGFTVLGVSLDQPGKHNAWIEAIHKDSLEWTHVSDLQYWDNAVAKQYGIRAIPQNFLLDQSGKIVAKNIRGEELENKLSEIVK